MSSKVVSFQASMSCQGCANAIKRVLGKVEGVSAVDADVEAKVVRVTCAESCDDQTLFAALQRWGTASGKAVAMLN